jgi:hypothetical protein
MPVIETYARRRQRETGEGLPEVYDYESIPDGLRVQVCYILDDSIGTFWKPRPVVGGMRPPHNNDAWQWLCGTMCREFGLASLGKGLTERDQCHDWLINQDSVDSWLSLVELGLGYVDDVMRGITRLEGFGAQHHADDAISEFNSRCRSAALGYQFDGGKIIRVDSQLLHAGRGLMRESPLTIAVTTPLHYASFERSLGRGTRVRSTALASCTVMAKAFPRTMSKRSSGIDSPLSKVSRARS